ncbi:MAG: hypothetical protein FGM41_02425 [Bacteroidetes bacterium]|nr:hypothetical protein [Bacteroidota bacterium]
MQVNHVNLSVEPKVIYDYIFCGAGASASLLILELHRNNLLQNKKVLLIDQEQKNRKDKTYCFWAQANEPIATHLQALISKSWDTFALSDAAQLSIAPLAYHHIDSIDLYKEVQALAKIYQWDTMVGSVTTIATSALGTFAEVNNTQHYGKHLFDSRTPIHLQTQKNDVLIYQSFVGWMIETDAEVINPAVFKFMDFNIAQQGFTQFVYVLPFSSTKALVEVTRFGAAQINKAEAEEILLQYIQANFGTHQKLAIETGCIPMSNCKIENETLAGVTTIGARNYHIKPSTGYAFKNMYNHAYNIAAQIKNGGALMEPNIADAAMPKGRFAFYDALLLDILKNNPQQGKPIFTALLKKVATPKILRFLDEKTKLSEEITIFYHLPWKPFLQALFKKTLGAAWVQPVILTLITLGLVALGKFTTIQSTIGYALFLVGMVVVGIPHGAVDHLLETGSWSLKKAPLFVFKYLLLSAVMGALWLLLPSLALASFLLYSAWHFGEADGKKWHLSALLSLLWGCSVLAYILGTHLAEVNVILAAMGKLSLPFALPIWALLPWFIWALYRRQWGLVITVLWLTLSSQIPLLLSFGIYFIGQHSITGWQHLQSHLSLSSKKIWWQSFPFHAGAWLLLILFYFFWPVQTYFEPNAQWGLFFIFIACLSFPHVIAMHLMYRKR